MSYVDFPKMHDDPMIFIETFTTAARAVISRGAATILVAGNPMNMFLIDHDVREVDGVPILDCCAAVVKTVEMLVDLDRLGIRRGQTGLFTAPPPNERVKLQYLFD
jgi:Asp/Glu/hydantoin racemase